MISFTITNKLVQVWPGSIPGQPMIYLNTFADEGAQILSQFRQISSRDFTLAAVSNLEWNRDMAPWDIPPISKNDTPCTGGADDYLRLLTETILPEVEKRLDGAIPWRGLAGYSLAGLFAVYAMYRTDVFSRFASISGSLWFPGINEYIQTHSFRRKPDCLYFSLGEKECRTKNPYLKCVRRNTEEIVSFFQTQEIDTSFELNSGNHFKDAAMRSAKGISWILNC